MTQWSACSGFYRTLEDSEHTSSIEWIESIGQGERDISKPDHIANIECPNPYILPLAVMPFWRKSMLKTLKFGLVISLYLGFFNASWADQKSDGFHEVNNFISSGSWYNPSRSGSGLILDVQANTLAGYYFGYDEEGAPVWRIFSAPLEHSIAGEYSVQAELIGFSSGPCTNCEYYPPEGQFTDGNIELVFSSIAEAKYRINDGNYTDIQPLYFGVVALIRVAGTFPTIRGQWVLVETSNSADAPAHEKTAKVIELFSPIIDRFGYFLIVGRKLSEGSHQSVVYGECGPAFSEERASCSFEVYGEETRVFTAPIGDFGGGKIIASGETGYIELIRLN